MKHKEQPLITVNSGAGLRLTKASFNPTLDGPQVREIKDVGVWSREYFNILALFYLLCNSQPRRHYLLLWYLKYINSGLLSYTGFILKVTHYQPSKSCFPGDAPPLRVLLLIAVLLEISRFPLNSPLPTLKPNQNQNTAHSSHKYMQPKVAEVQSLQCGQANK